MSGDPTPIATRKSSLRRALRQRRREAFPSEARVWEGGSYLAQVAALASGSGGMVAAYRSVGVEPPTMPLLAFLHERRLETVVPWARDPREAAGKWRDRWVSWPPDEAIRERPESRTPAGDTAPSEVLRRVGCAIVPALAVARDGTRLGQGGGWYDRALQLVTPGVAVLAMVNPAEVLPAGEVPRERHDIPVAGAVLPGGIVWFDDRVAVAVSRQPRAE